MFDKCQTELSYKYNAFASPQGTAGGGHPGRVRGRDPPPRVRPLHGVARPGGGQGGRARAGKREKYHKHCIRMIRQSPPRPTGTCWVWETTKKRRSPSSSLAAIRTQEWFFLLKSLTPRSKKFMFSCAHYIKQSLATKLKSSEKKNSFTEARTRCIPVLCTVSNLFAK